MCPSMEKQVNGNVKYFLMERERERDMPISLKFIFTNFYNGN